MDSQLRPPQAPISYTARMQVRYSDLDMLEHVNNAVYLQYVQEAAMRHAEAVGYGYGRMRELGGSFVVRRHEIEYSRAARAGDELLVTIPADVISVFPTEEAEVQPTETSL
ncbi:MAG: acyl-CoA thioesterase [Dehalococcoidales bacterium]|nr:acyl-CoA thioesterase [Dehalococcoidales bacterium]